MKIDIGEQIPYKIKLFANNCMMIPTQARKDLGWKAGDTIEIYATTNGLILRKGRKKYEKRTKVQN